MDFTFKPEQAIEAYNNWKHSQWLVPQGFASQMDPTMFIPTYLPFYAFSTFTHTVHSGQVGNFKPSHAEGEEEDPKGGDYDFAPEIGKSATHIQLHPDVLVYAPTFELVTTPDYDLMQEIWYWKLDDIKPHSTVLHRVSSMPKLSRSSSAVDFKTLKPVTVQEAWRFAHQKLHRNERYCAAQTLKRERRCDIVENVKTDTNFSHISVKLINIPVYMWTHNYLGVTYHTVMNAQNGLICGRRPYALKSSLDSFIKLLAGGEHGVGKNNNITGVLTGADLAVRDNFTTGTSPYRADKTYLVFPPSDQFLVVLATGWLRIVNLSESDEVELVAQKRISDHVGKSLTLSPGEEKVVAYRGAWCLCVMDGDPKSVMIAYACTNSGGDKEDLMGMVEV